MPMTDMSGVPGSGAKGMYFAHVQFAQLSIVQLSPQGVFFFPLATE